MLTSPKLMKKKPRDLCMVQWHAFGGNWVETAALNYFQLYGKSMLRRAFLATAAVIVTWCCRSANTYDTQIARFVCYYYVSRLLVTKAQHLDSRSFQLPCATPQLKWVSSCIQHTSFP